MRAIYIRPSTANLWASPDGCLASCSFEPAAHGSEETVHTLRGTRLHEAVACIIDPERPTPLLEKGEWALAQEAVAQLEAHVDVDAYEWRTETKVGRHMGLDGTQGVWMDGTPDLVGVGKLGSWRARARVKGEPRMVLVDFKFGSIPVEAEENQQLAAYAVMLLLGTDTWARRLKWKDDDIVRTIIVQPAAAERGDPVVKKATLTYRDVKNAEKVFDALVDRASDPDHEFEYNPSPANCRYCRGAATGECPEVVRTMVRAEESVAAIADYGLLPPSGYTDFLAKAEMVAEMAKHVKEDAHRRLTRGEPVRGLKLVPGRAGNRKWIDEDAAVKALRDMGDHGARVDPFTAPRLKTPAALERELKREGASASLEVMAEHCDRAAATTVVAYEGDPRRGLDDTAMARALDHFNQPESGDRDGA